MYHCWRATGNGETDQYGGCSGLTFSPPTQQRPQQLSSSETLMMQHAVAVALSALPARWVVDRMGDSKNTVVKAGTWRLYKATARVVAGGDCIDAGAER